VWRPVSSTDLASTRRWREDSGARRDRAIRLGQGPPGRDGPRAGWL